MAEEKEINREQVKPCPFCPLSDDEKGGLMKATMEGENGTYEVYRCNIDNTKCSLVEAYERIDRALRVAFQSGDSGPTVYGEGFSPDTQRLGGGS